MDKRMKIIYEDNDLIVCYKEAGFPVQSSGFGTADMESELKKELYLRDETKGEPYIGIVHRLDQPVEGILVFAKQKKAAARLSEQAAGDGMKKIYHAVVMWPQGKSEEGSLTDYLIKDNRTNSSKVVAAGTGGAKKAELDYRFLEKSKKEEGAALVEIRLHTGRHHQIRVQMSHAGMPLLGDSKYGFMPDGACSGKTEDGKKNKDKRRTKIFPALCAVSLEFVHPGTGKTMQFSCEPKGKFF